MGQNGLVVCRGGNEEREKRNEWNENNDGGGGRCETMQSMPPLSRQKNLKIDYNGKAFRRRSRGLKPDTDILVTAASGDRKWQVERTFSILTTVAAT